MSKNLPSAAVVIGALRVKNVNMCNILVEIKYFQANFFSFYRIFQNMDNISPHANV